MTSDWQEYRLGDVTRWASGGTPSKQNPEYWGGSIAWISASSMKAKICANSDERITEEAVRSGARMCDPGTILLLVRGSELHKRIPIGVATKRVAFNQDVKAITTCSGDLSGDYLYYLLKGSEEFLLNSVEFTGIGAGKLETPFLQDLVFPLPTREEQAAITDFMIALDDKIELNRKTNETLEAMAKALFKSWFVDFDPVRAKAEGRPTGLPGEISDLFPDSFEGSELGEIPSGWEVGGLEEFLVLQRGFDLPAPQRIKGAYPVVAASGVSGTHNEPMAFAPGVVTGRSGVLGKVFYIQTDFFPLNTTLWAKEFRLATPIYGYFLLCDIDFAVFNAGSAVPTLNRNHLGSLRFPLPTKALVVSFTEVAVDLMKRKEGIVAETSNLSATRDALLPKLISGEIRIPDAEKILEEVGI
jgi:type I restriction enzyme S subunit